VGGHFAGGGVVDVMVSRSTDGGLTWGAPVTVAASGVFYDKNWTTCDNTPASPFYGHCYTEFDNASGGELELMSTSAHGGLSWGPAPPTPAHIHGLRRAPRRQPNRPVLGPVAGVCRHPALTPPPPPRTPPVSTPPTPPTHAPGGRPPPLPPPEPTRHGRVYVAWQDTRFEPGGTANDIVLSHSADGTTWSPVRRIPLNPVGSNVDHFIPGLAVNRTSAGGHTQLALTYYFDTNPSCSGSACQIQVGFPSSPHNGQTWSARHILSHPMQLG